MGSALSTTTCCIGYRKKGAISLSEKTQYAQLHFTNPTNDDKMAANRIFAILQTSSTRDEAQYKLQQLKKDHFYAACNWEGVAVWLLEGVKAAIEKGTEMSEVMRKTYGDVKGDYDAWKEENPEFAMIVEISSEIALTVIALAVLAALLPWVLDAFGFGTLGPRLGSWAARWQSVYLGETPSDSLFSFLQSMGMIYGKSVGAML